MLIGWTKDFLTTSIDVLSPSSMRQQGQSSICNGGPIGGDITYWTAYASIDVKYVDPKNKKRKKTRFL